MTIADVYTFFVGGISFDDSYWKLDLLRICAALIAHSGCLAFESQGAFASQR